MYAAVITAIAWGLLKPMIRIEKYIGHETHNKTLFVLDNSTDY